MSGFASYLKYKRRHIGAFCLFVGLFLVSFYLYHLPVAAVLYPAGLCALLGGGMLGLDYLKTARSCRQIERLKGLTAELMDTLPEPNSVTDEGYHALIHALRQQQLETGERAAADYRGMVDYYTVWAHQIKTPIASMRLNLQNEDSAQSRLLQNDLNRVEQYVDMVLNYLRMDSDYTDFVIRPCALDGIIRRSVRKFAKQFIRKRIRLRYEGTGAQALTDEKWLGFVLDQLLANALKYTASGWIAIRAGEGEITVEDTGMGIAPEDLPRVFDKGYTGYNGRTDQKSTGIGLYLCKRILGMLGHGIEIESRPGEGTRV